MRRRRGDDRGRTDRLREGLVSCEACGLLSRPAHAEEPGDCPRCGEELEFRRRDAIQRILGADPRRGDLLPPGQHPAGDADDHADVRGARHHHQRGRLLYTSGSWYLALILLIASVMIPLAKLAALAYLLITVQRGSIRNNRERARLYRVLEIIGRWSMVDVFVATFVVALIQLQPLMSVVPEPGVLFFSAVVILTIFAAESFDPRLIWDSSQGKQEKMTENADLTNVPEATPSRRNGRGSRSSGSSRSSPRWSASGSSCSST